MSVNTDLHCTCHSGVWKRRVGKWGAWPTYECHWQMFSVPGAQHSGNRWDVQLNETDSPGKQTLWRRMATKYVQSNQWGCPILRWMSELDCCAFELFQVETSTDGAEIVSLIWEPGRKATVLAHNDFAVDGPGVQTTSRGAGHSFKSSTWIKMIGASGPFWMPTVGPVAWRTTCWGPTKGILVYVEPPEGNSATPTIPPETYE